MRFTGSIVLLSSVLLLVGCGGSSSPATTEGENNDNNDTSDNANLSAHQAALTEISNVVLAALGDSQTTASSLSTSVAAYCDELEASSANIETARTDAQSAWRASMNDWQVAEVINFGPSLDGGNNSPRERIYSWPAVSNCFVDGAVVDYNDDKAGFSLTNQTPRRVGLDALEYLLFSDNLDHSCSTDTSTTSDTHGAWNSRTEAERRLARCEYAEVVADGLVTSISGVISSWESGYQTQFTTAGSSSTTFGSATEALNEVSDALFYVESEVKDLKLAEPTGISAECSESSCPERIESTLSGNALANIKANLQGALALIDAGIDDLLASVDQASIATTMKADLNVAIVNIDNFQGSFIDSVTAIDEANCTNTTSDSRLEEACALHADVKKVTDVLKSDFVTALTLAIPTSSVGDND